MSKPLHQIETIDEYIGAFLGALGKSAQEKVRPLHVPGVTPLREIELKKVLFEAQKHAVAALDCMMHERGSGFLCGEMGTGKTIMGMAAVHAHAAGKPYRAIVLCPDHLIDKWCREIRSWIPGAGVTRFGPDGEHKDDDVTGTRQAMRDMMSLADRLSAGEEHRSLPTGVHQVRKRRPAPNGPEWYVLGKNQAKYMSDWVGDGEKNYKDFCRCTKCGSKIVDKKGEVIRPGKITRKQAKQSCQSIILKAQFSPTTPDKPGGQWIATPDGCTVYKDGDHVSMYGQTWVASKCGEPLYSYTAKPYRWSPAHIVQRKLRGAFRYLVLDEGHEHKSADAQQAVASSKLIGSVRHVLALTGTLVGGYAHHLFPLMMRITPESLLADGFSWQSTTNFSRQCGRVDTHTTTTTYPKKPREKEPKKTVVNKAVLAPGIMPTIYARHLIGTSVFLGLSELHDALPDLFEYSGGEIGKDAPEGMRTGYYDTAIKMDPELRDAVHKVTKACRDANAELLRKNSRKFLGGAMWACMDYPDHPFAWSHPDHLIESWQDDGHPKSTPNHLHTIGYYDTDAGEEKSHKNWEGVITPPALPMERIYPKEQALIDICLKQEQEGRQTWVYVTMTGKRDIQPRLQSILQKEGLHVGILRANTVAPIDREKWIEEHGKNYDVIISNAELVKTGLDLFSPNGTHNFSTLIFFQTGYNPFTMRQASRRAWRVGQDLDCRVYYLYYLETAQEAAMTLMARKMSASQSLEGNFDSDGLASMAGEDILTLELMRTLSHGIEAEGVQRSWEKSK